jgi:hypothetical protein
LDNVVAVLANEPIADGSIEKHIGGNGVVKEPSGNDGANAASLALKLCHFGRGYGALHVIR